MLADQTYSVLLHHLGHLVATVPRWTRHQVYTRLAEAVDIHPVFKEDR